MNSLERRGFALAVCKKLQIDECGSSASWFEVLNTKWSVSQLTVGLRQMLRGRSERSVDHGRGQERSLGFQFRQERLQIGSIEFPVERAWLAVRQFLV